MWKFSVELSLLDIAIPLRIDFDWRIGGPFFQIHLLIFKFSWFKKL